jgi:hypothetical protein
VIAVAPKALSQLVEQSGRPFLVAFPHQMHPDIAASRHMLDQVDVVGEAGHGGGSEGLAAPA